MMHAEQPTRSASRCAPATPRRRGGVEAGEAEACGCGPGSCCGPERRRRLLRRGAVQRARARRAARRRRLASLGCGNPTAVADLREGEVVLDLGSGGGIDVLLSARRVGPSGKAYGLDMTDEMLDLARRNAAEAGAATSSS